MTSKANTEIWLDTIFYVFFKNKYN